jgi:cysteine synthase A
VHPTGSLKHGLACSLFLYALCNGWLGPDSIVVEASSGSTAASEGPLRSAAGVAVRRRRTALHVEREDRPDPLPRR